MAPQANGALRREVRGSGTSRVAGFVERAVMHRYYFVALILAIAGCSGSSYMTPQSGGGVLDTPQSISPGSIAAPPMAKTAVLPSSAMQSPPDGLTPLSMFQGVSYTQVPGTASYAAAAPDGSLWVLSNAPAGADKYIWHYVSGTWTNITGLANHISAAPDGSLYASNSGGGAYHYVGTTWTALGGGVSDIAAASDNSLYVLSNGFGAGNIEPIFHYTTSWSQIPGAGVHIAASNDANSHVIPAGVIQPYGLYVINAGGSIYYTPGNGTYVQLPGAASAISPSSGGVFVLGYPSNGGGNVIYYYDLDTPGYTVPGGSGVGISANSANLYALAPSGAIFSTKLLPAAVGVGFMRQMSASKVTDTLGTSLTSILGVAISEAGDQTSSGSAGTMTLGSLTIGSGTTAQSTALRPESTMSHIAVEGGGTHLSAPDGPDTTWQVHALLQQLPRAAAGGVTRRTPFDSTIGTNPTVGATASIWAAVFAIGSSTATYQQVASTLEYQGSRTNVWIDNSLLTGAKSSASFQGGALATTIAALGADFDNAYASDTSHFASPDYPDTAPGRSVMYGTCDNTGAATGMALPQYITEPTDKRVNVLVLNSANLGAGVGGYFSSVNYFPQAVWNCLIGHGGTVPMSNEAPFIYIGWFDANGAPYELNEDAVRGTAHELQHLINFVNHSILPAAANSFAFNGSEDPFINEGLSMLSQDLAVNRLNSSVPFDVADAMGHAQQFLSSPQNYSVSGFIGIDPASWGGNGTTPRYNCGGGCYGSGYLFQRYLRDRFGGDAYTAGMETSGVTGFANLQVNGGNEPAAGLLGDFAMAIAVNSQQMTPTTTAFNLGTFNTRHTYTDQFGFGRTLTGVASSPAAIAVNGSSGLTPPLGGFAFFGFSPSNGEAVSIVDNNGAFGLVGGLAQH